MYIIIYKKHLNCGGALTFSVSDQVVYYEERTQSNSINTERYKVVSFYEIHKEFYSYKRYAKWNERCNK